MFVNGERLSGAVPEAELRSVIDRALKDAGQTPPPAPPKSASVEQPGQGGEQARGASKPQ